MKKLTSLLLALLLSVSVLSSLPQAVCRAAEEPEPVPAAVSDPEGPQEPKEPGEPVGLNDSGDVIDPNRFDS